MRKRHILAIATITGIFSSIQAIAQLALNLDFETLSIEGTARPWGWNLTSGLAAMASLDSLVKHQGDYSLKMETTSAGDPELPAMSFYLEPFELQNNSVTIEGWVKGPGSFSLSYSAAGDTSITEIKSKPARNSADWVQLSIDAKLPEKISSIYLAVKQESAGSVWFDNFSLSVVGKKMARLEVAEPFTGSQVKWMENNSHPVKSVDTAPAGAKPDHEDLAFFKSMAGDARIIALGESTHGTSEFFRLKHRILEYCVQNLGVRVFAIEDNQLIVTRVNEYVKGGKGTARSSMYGMFGVWQTREVNDLIQWVRDYNDLHPEDKIEFVGFDIQDATIPIDSLYSFAARRSPGLFDKAAELLDDLRQNGMNYYMASDSAKLAWFENAGKVLDMLTSNSAEWLFQAKDGQDSMSVYWGIQYATLVKQFAENAHKGHWSLYRDVAMAENVSWILDVYKPGAKMLIWAHDVHISRGEHPDSEMNIYFGRSMGAHLSKKYGKDYIAFGLFTYQGEYSCYVSYTNFTVTDCPLYVAPKGSLDEALHRVVLDKKTPALLLDLRKAKSLDWLSRPVPVRFANHVNFEYGYWTRYSIPYQFDGIFFIDKTTSAKSYARE